jgi:hypothetical protein
VDFHQHFSITGHRLFHLLKAHAFFRAAAQINNSFYDNSLHSYRNRNIIPCPIMLSNPYETGSLVLPHPFALTHIG